MRVILCALALFCGGLIAADVSVNLSGTAPGNFSNKLQDTDVEVARFVLQASGGSVSIDSITVHYTNPTAAASAFPLVKLFYDANGNGTFEAGEQVGNSQAAGAGPTADSLLFTPAMALSVPTALRNLQVRVDIGTSGALYGEQFRFRIDAAGSIALTNGGDTVSGTFPVQGNFLTIRHSENRIQPGTGNPATVRTLNLDSSNVGALHFLVESLVGTLPGELVGIDLVSISINVTLATAAQIPAIERVTLWQDDGDGAFEPGSGEVQILQRTPADIGKWNPSGNVITVVFDGTPISTLADIPAGGVRTFWVGLHFGDTPCTCDVSVVPSGIVGALGANADFMQTVPASVAGAVINTQKKKSSPKVAEADGEGGCSTEGNTSLLVLAAVLVAVLLPLQRKLRTRSDT